MTNIKKIRAQFPFLKRRFNGRILAYLDNASTTQKPKAVIEALSDAYENHYANIHRGVYDLSVEATDLYEGVREKVRKFINAASSQEIIFTRNATEGINLVAYCLFENLKDGDEILLTQMEHHSNIVPWQLIAGRLTTVDNSQLTIDKDSKIKIRYIPIMQDGRLNMSSLERLVTKKTKIVSLTLMSNVLGTINPVKKIIGRIRQLSTVNRQPAPLVLVDAAQAVAHVKIDVANLGCDFLVFSAHKMYGTAGVGVLWGRKELLRAMPPFMGGGDMILAVDFEKTTFNVLPWKFEAGTPNIADVIATGAAIDFIESIGFLQIARHEMELTEYALDQLANDPNVQLYGPLDLAGRGPVISFNVDGVHPHDVASILSDEAVAIRSGHHCAQPLMGVLGIDAACRASFGIYNTREEIERLMEGIEKVKKIFRISNIAGPVPPFLPAYAKASAGKPASKSSAAVSLEAKRSGVGSPSSRATRNGIGKIVV